MDFADQIRAIAVQIPRLKDLGVIKTEEGTKNALVMPFINALGYNVFNPLEVTPELVADVGVKKGEKVDYAILQDGKPCILIECKPFGVDLNTVHSSQLYRYFSVTEARFGIVTNGAVYHFYTDLEAPNKMDQKPFLVFDLTDMKDSLLEEVKKFTKTAFNVDTILSTASELKYTNELKKLVVAQLTQPSDEFVRFFANQVYPGRMTQPVLAQFTELTKRAWREVISDRIKETFNKAARVEDASQTATQELPKVDDAKASPDGKVITTDDELQGYQIVRAILREVVDVKRVTMRDAQTYCAILLDDNNRRPLCRLHLNGSKKYVSLFDQDRKEEKVLISGVDDLFSFADRLKATAVLYEPAQ